MAKTETKGTVIKVDKVEEFLKKKKRGSAYYAVDVGFIKQYRVKPFLYTILNWDVFAIDAVIERTMSGETSRRPDFELWKNDRVYVMIDCRTEKDILDSISDTLMQEYKKYLEVMRKGVFIITNGKEYDFYITETGKLVTDKAIYKLNLEKLNADDVEVLNYLEYGHIDTEELYSFLYGLYKQHMYVFPIKQELERVRGIYERVNMPEVPFVQFAAGITGKSKEEVEQMLLVAGKYVEKGNLDDVKENEEKEKGYEIVSDSEKVNESESCDFLALTEEADLDVEEDEQWRIKTLQSGKLPDVIELVPKSKKAAKAKVIFEPKTQKSVVCIGAEIKPFKVNNKSKAGFQYTRWLKIVKKYCDKNLVCKKVVPFTRLSSAAEFIEGTPYKNGFAYFRVLGTELTIGEWLKAQAVEYGIIK